MAATRFDDLMTMRTVADMGCVYDRHVEAAEDAFASISFEHMMAKEMDTDFFHHLHMTALEMGYWAERHRTLKRYYEEGVALLKEIRANRALS